MWDINAFPPELKEQYDTPEEIYESLLNYPHRSNKFIVPPVISEQTSVFGKPGGRSIEYKYNWCPEGLCPPNIPQQEKIRQEYRVEGNTIYLTTYRVNQGIEDNLADNDGNFQTKSAFDLYRITGDQMGASFKPLPSPPPPPPPLTSSERGHCTDGKDNDGDGLININDPDCLTPPPPPPPLASSERGHCTDGKDNDGDGLIDLNDPDCLTPPPPPSKETICDDGKDNDADGLVDAADPDCPKKPLPPSKETICDDGKDNDADGLVDAARSRLSKETSTTF